MLVCNKHRPCTGVEKTSVQGNKQMAFIGLQAATSQLVFRQATVLNAINT